MLQLIKNTVVASLLVSVLLAFTLMPQADAQENETRTIRVITYNVQFLPSFASMANKRKQPEYRAARIGEEMAEYDIVCLNETFDEKKRAIILDKLREAWGDDFDVMLSPKPEDRFNGGCLIASRLPILEKNSHIYTKYSKPEDYGIRADGYAAKGVIHARIALSADDATRTVDVFATHLEARDSNIREEQYPEISDFIREHREDGRPALILGDMNTRGNPNYREDPNSQYARFMAALRKGMKEAELIDLWPALKGDELGGTSDQESTETGNRIDYILLANPPTKTNQLTPLTIKVKLYQDPKTIALSDHNAVEAALRW